MQQKSIIVFSWKIVQMYHIHQQHIFVPLQTRNMMKQWRIIFGLCLCIFSLVNAYAQSLETILQQAKKFYDENNYPLSQEKYLKAFKQAEKENNPSVMARASLSLARCYYFLNDHANAFKWSYNALHIIQKHRIDTLLSQTYYYLGALYIEAKKVDSAKKYSFKAIELLQKEKDYSRLSQTYSTLAQLHIITSKDVTSIENMIDSAEKYAKMAENKAMMGFAASKRFNYCFFIKKDYEEALEHINKAEKLYLEAGSREAILNAFRGKAECLIMLRDTAARTYMLKWFAFKDSVFQAEKSANIAKYETLFETEKKDRENQLLQQENKLNRLLLFVIAVLVLLLIALGLWLYNRNNLKKKQHELLMLQSLQHDKERIARDLHDNVGGQLSYILYSLDGINDEDKEKRNDVIESINQSVRSVINSLRETIWAISDANINVQDF